MTQIFKVTGYLFAPAEGEVNDEDFRCCEVQTSWLIW